MAIDFSTPIKTLGGDPVMDGETPVTVGKLAVEALLAVLDAGGRPENLTGAQKVQYAKLAERIHYAAEPIVLKAEDVAVIKDRIGRGYSALLVMRCWEILDPGE